VEIKSLVWEVKIVTFSFQIAFHLLFDF